MTGPGSLGGVSIRGASHVRANLPNQDAFGHDIAGEWRFLAVADGHGSPRHHRSDRGAKFAVATALAVLRRASATAGRDPGLVVSRLADDLLAGWREQVAADIRAAAPLRERPGFDSLAVYGTTCLAAGIGPGMSLFLQIGDGDLLASIPSGAVARVVPVDPDLAGPGTYSLCQPDAVDRVHVRLFSAPHPLSAPDFVLAVTDGLSNSYPQDADFLTVVESVRSGVRVAGMDAFLRDLEPWLVECSRLGSRDDVTVALFSDGSVGAPRTADDAAVSETSGML